MIRRIHSRIAWRLLEKNWTRKMQDQFTGIVMSIHTYSIYDFLVFTNIQLLSVNLHSTVTTQTMSLYRNPIKVQLKRKWQKSMRV